MKEPYANLLEDRRRSLREELAPIFHLRPEFVCEIGCGHGHFLTAYATAHPEKTCLGVDLVAERIDRARRKRDRARLTNLHFLRGEARLFLGVLPEHVRISTLFILFPDPWPKLRHQKHRIIQPSFLETVADLATSHCRLYFRTDYLPYFEEAQATIGSHPQWTLVEEPWEFEFETVFQQRASTFSSLVAKLRRSDD